MRKDLRAIVDGVPAKIAEYVDSNKEFQPTGGKTSEAIVPLGNTVAAIAHVVEALKEAVAEADPQARFNGYCQKVADMLGHARTLEKYELTRFRHIKPITEIIMELKKTFNSFSETKGERSCPEVAEDHHGELAFALIYCHGIEAVTDKLDGVVQLLGQSRLPGTGVLRKLVESTAKDNGKRKEITESRIEAVAPGELTASAAGESASMFGGAAAPEGKLEAEPLNPDAVAQDALGLGAAQG
jgi:hypothetical protein